MAQNITDSVSGLKARLTKDPLQEIEISPTITMGKKLGGFAIELGDDIRAIDDFNRQPFLGKGR